MDDEIHGMIIGFLAAGLLVSGLIGLLDFNPKVRCQFERNEPGPQGWWWEIYKCSDGTERRELVASPRG